MKKNNMKKTVKNLKINLNQMNNIKKKVKLNKALRMRLDNNQT